MGVKTLTLEQCKEYLRNIKDLEISCYQQERLIQKLKQQPIATKRAITVLEQHLQQDKAPEKPKNQTSMIIDTIIGIPLGALIGALFGLILAIILRILLAIFTSMTLVGSPWKPYLFWGAIVGAIFLVIICIIDTNKEEEKKKKNYPEELEKYQTRQQRDKDLISLKTRQLEIILPREIEKSEQTYKVTKDLLKKYYNLGFLYPKYHGIVPVCTIYEYLESGRCFSLLGHEGAYNLYESELRMNMVIGKLDDIITRLDDISANQQLLVQEIRKSNSRIENISRSLNNIENSTALTAYYSAITASNTSYLSWLETWVRI